MTYATRPRTSTSSSRPGSEAWQKMQSVVMSVLALVTYASLQGAHRRSIGNLGLGDMGTQERQPVVPRPWFRFLDRHPVRRHRGLTGRRRGGGCGFLVDQLFELFPRLE